MGMKLPEVVRWLRANSEFEFTLVREEHKGKKIQMVMAMKPNRLAPGRGKYVLFTNNEPWHIEGRGGLIEVAEALKTSLNPPKPKKKESEAKTVI